MVDGRTWSDPIQDVWFEVAEDEQYQEDVDYERKSAIEAFNTLHDGLYTVLDWYTDSDKRSFSTDSSRYMPDELGAAWDDWQQRRKEPNAVMKLERETPRGSIVEVYDIELRRETPVKDGSDLNILKPFSAMSAVHRTTNKRYGIRVFRDYDMDVLYRSGQIDGRSMDPEKRQLRSTDIDDDKISAARQGEDVQMEPLGWVTEPYLQAALDRADGVDRYIAEDADSAFVPLNWERHAYIDTDTEPAYSRSGFEAAILYEWLDPVDDAVSMQDDYYRELGRHAGTMHALGLTNFLDRTADEFYWDASPEKEERYAIEGDLEFTLHTTDQEWLERDLQDVQAAACALARDAEDGITEDRRHEINALVRESRDAVLARADSEAPQWLLDNLPAEWETSLFEDHKLIGL